MIMAITDDGNGLPSGPLAPLLIGLLIAVIGGAMGPLTGFAMNPARDFGPKLMTFLAGWGDVAFTGGRDIPYFLVPIFAPILGACLGAAGYKALICRHLPGLARPPVMHQNPRKRPLPKWAPRSPMSAKFAKETSP